MDAPLRSALAAALGSEVSSARPVAGGDINEAYAVELADGRRAFAKTNRRAPRGMFAAEAHGLAWLAEPSAVRLPRVLAASSADDEARGAPAFLALELIDRGSPRARFDEGLGRGLAMLHAAGPPRFGLARDNFIGPLPQPNAELESWAAFYRERRLEPLVRRAVDRGLFAADTRRRFGALFERLENLCGPPEPPARLHGDLWGGNLMVDESGAPCLIDPAAYGGHREVDLAMMRLFGGFGARVFAAYDEAFPLEPGHPERVPLYQLYPLLVHAVLFGGSYVASVEEALDDLV